jgi:hypothetical protein
LKTLMHQMNALSSCSAKKCVNRMKNLKIMPRSPSSMIRYYFLGSTSTRLPFEAPDLSRQISASFRGLVSESACSDLVYFLAVKFHLEGKLQIISSMLVDLLPSNILQKEDLTLMERRILEQASSFERDKRSPQDLKCEAVQHIVRVPAILGRRFSIKVWAFACRCPFTSALMYQYVKHNALGC